jgi:hypothetical protein
MAWRRPKIVSILLSASRIAGFKPYVAERLNYASDLFSISVMSHWGYCGALWAVYRSKWFRSYCFIFGAAWIVGKLANAVPAAGAGLPPLGFRPVGELVALGWEFLVLVIALRRRGEHLLLANWGLSPRDLAAPFVILHIILSYSLSLTAR